MSTPTARSSRPIRSRSASRWPAIRASRSPSRSLSTMALVSASVRRPSSCQSCAYAGRARSARR
ncbi:MULTISPECIES: hypothetical protein [Streptomyces]|uniref:hypothetical protein n=1 Tax=Streptomyces TaxID=1883 RepID=UPI0020BDFB5C|nr:hypothetical protein [Streptomyces sp. 43Y-GA-1]MCL6290361.1 hypothetical protein [Streptomyces sp. 43Y-GA-1]